MTDAGPWLGDPGKDGDVVISSRVRVARNLQRLPFVSRCSAEQRRSVISRVEEASEGAEVKWEHFEGEPDQHCKLLLERHLISARFSADKGPRALGLDPSSTLSVMVNEEDHLRIQSLACGARLDEAFQAAMAFDASVAPRAQYAFHERWGYLTACPTNVGCGLRLSVMLHLPGLRACDELRRVKRAAQELHLAIRGFHGEGSPTVADLYQVSNQVTLGLSEEDLLTDFRDRVVPQMIAYEREARSALVDADLPSLQDRTERALALLRHARLMRADEAMRHLGRMRLAVSLRLVEGLTLADIDSLVLAVQPLHLAGLGRSAGEDWAADEMTSRANFLRKALAKATVR